MDASSSNQNAKDSTKDNAEHEVSFVSGINRFTIYCETSFSSFQFFSPANTYPTAPSGMDASISSQSDNESRKDNTDDEVYSIPMTNNVQRI